MGPLLHWRSYRQLRIQTIIYTCIAHETTVREFKMFSLLPYEIL